MAASMANRVTGLCSAVNWRFAELFLKNEMPAFQEVKPRSEVERRKRGRACDAKLATFLGLSVQTSRQRNRPRLRFGQFEADLQKEELYKRGLPVRLENLPFRVLAALLEHPGSPMTREELCARLWPDGTHVDFDEGLNTAVKKLRRALGDSSDTPLFIETIPRKGYILVAPVSEADPPTDGMLANPPTEISHTLPVDGQFASFAQNPTRKFTYWIVFAAACLTFILWLVLRYRVVPQPDFVRLSFGRGTILSARLTPDGQQAVYGAAWDGKPFRLFLGRFGSPDIRDLGVDADILAISRSGQMAILMDRRFGFGTVSSRGMLATMSLTGSVPKEMLDEVSSADWSPDGSQLAVVHYSGETCRVEFPVGHVVYQTTGGAWISHARVSPVGDRIAFLEHPLANDDTGHAVILQLRSQQKILSKDFYGIVGLAWKDAKELLFTASQAGVGGGRALFSLNTSGEQLLLHRESIALTIQDVTPDGGLLLTRNVQGDELLGHFGEGERDRIISCLSICVPSELSADGSQILLSVQGEGTGTGYKTYVMSTAAGAAPKLLGDGMPTGFSPDLQSVLVVFPWGINPSEVPQIRAIPVGPGEPRTITRDSISHIWATWFPDGTKLLFIGAEPQHATRTWIQDLHTGKATPLTPESVLGLKISPDGETVAAIGLDHKLWLYPASGKTPRPLGNVNAVEEVERWSEDGKYLFLTTYGLPAEVNRIDISTGARTLIRHVAPPDASGVLAVGPVLISADDRFYVYAYPRVLSTLYLAHGF
ncbi:MAG TPA: winged helix-turn-helix domain-containing protein [Candidatus Acidoferrales bacterium]|nr:winged helix-turn-helix domain-containing protein [Candidatus Acidoferrales bacterium]